MWVRTQGPLSAVQTFFDPLLFLLLSERCFFHSFTVTKRQSPLKEVTAKGLEKELTCPPLLVWYRSQITFLTVSLPHKTKAHPWDALSTCSYTSSSFPYYITIQNPVCFFHLRLRCQHLQLWMHSVFGWAGSKQHFISPCCA